MHGQEKPFLSLRSCCLYQADVALFADRAWLDDACIAFYFEVLQAKADVIFGRVVLVEEESEELLKHRPSAVLYKDGHGDGRGKVESSCKSKEQSSCPRINKTGAKVKPEDASRGGQELEPSGMTQERNRCSKFTKVGEELEGKDVSPGGVEAGYSHLVTGKRPCFQLANTGKEGENKSASTAFFARGEECIDSGRRQRGVVLPPGDNSLGKGGKLNARKQDCRWLPNRRKHIDDGRSTVDTDKWRLSSVILGQVHLSETMWLPVLKALIVVKPLQQADTTDSARSEADRSRQHKNKNDPHFWHSFPRFKTFENLCTPIVFVDPCVAFWIAFSDDDEDRNTVLTNLSLHKRQVVLWPISDKQDLSAPGGTHWTLLVQVVHGVVSPSGDGSLKACHVHPCQADTASAGHLSSDDTPLSRKHTFFHLDSLSPRSPSCASVAAAQRLQRQILAHLKLPHSEQNTNTTPQCVKCVCPQANSSDCGVYCLIYAEKVLAEVAEWWAQKCEGCADCGKHRNKPEPNGSGEETARGRTHRPLTLNLQAIQQVQPAEALAKRKEIALLIERLKDD